MTVRPSHAPRAGFSLVELLVVLFLCAVVLALAYWILASNMGVAKVGMNRATVFANARAARALLATDFQSMLGPLPNPPLYPDRDPATLAPAMRTGVPRGILMVVPGLRQGTLPESNGRTVNLRCDQLFFLADTQNGGSVQTAVAPYTSVSRPTLSSTQAAIWIGPVSDSDESGDALSWGVGRQAVLLTGNGASPPFDGTSLSPLKPAWRTGDTLDTTASSIADWLIAQNPVPGIPPQARDANAILAFAVPVPTSPMPSSGPAGGWPTVVSDPLADGAVTGGDVTAAQRLLLKHCSEMIVQVALDRNANGLPETTNAPSGNDYGRNQAPWDGQTMPKRDLDGDIVWFPSDQDVNDDAAMARSPRVFWPQDAQPRIVHYGYYQGPADAAGKAAVAGTAYGYWKNYWGDWTPYPPITLSTLPNPAVFNLPDGTAPSTTNFGDAVCYGDYLPCAWSATKAYSVGDIVTQAPAPWSAAAAYATGTAVSYGGLTYVALANNTNSQPPNANWTRTSGAPVYKALAANTNSQPPNANWVQLTGTDQLSAADYAQAMANYATLHGWNPARQRTAGPGNPLYDQPPPPQSSWPQLLRIRLRLHDRGGVVRAYADDFLTNHRNDNGDPTRAANADDPSGDEGRATGLWFEYVFNLSYPRTTPVIQPPGTTP